MMHLDLEAAFRLPNARSTPGTIRADCPLCSAKNQPLCLFTGAKRKAIWHCHGGCSSEDLRQHLFSIGVLEHSSSTIPAPISARSPSKSFFQWSSRLLNECKAVEDSELLQCYLSSRGAWNFTDDSPFAKYIDDLFWHPYSERMIGVVRAKTGEIRGLHTTVIHNNIRGERKFHGVVKGHAVRLFEVKPDLAVAEGIETALCYTLATNTHCWSVLSATGMGSFDIPRGIRKLTIVADFDGPGLNGAERLSVLARLRNVECHIRLPGNDVVQNAYRTDFLDYANELASPNKEH